MNKVKIGGAILLALLSIGLINRAFNGKKIDKRNAERDSLAIVAVKEDSLSAINEASSRKALISDIEQSSYVKEVFINEANVLYVSVSYRTEPHNWDSVSKFFCAKVKNSGSSISRVKIVAAGTTKSPERDNAFGILLAEATCQ
jgi:hypothetical protein